jgi:Uma2 family endonuclease
MIAQLDRPTQDQRMIQSGLTWHQFKLIQEGFAQSPGVRLFYYNGTIELLMPGRDHEFFSRIIGYLVMTFCFERGVRCIPTGAMTQEREGVSSVQADESYCIGGVKPIPDVSIEIIFTSGNTSKLAKYRALGVPEVWFWEDGAFALYHLQGDDYQQVSRSQIGGLESLDLALLTRCVLMAETDELEAVSSFRQGIANQHE